MYLSVAPRQGKVPFPIMRHLRHIRPVKHKKSNITAERFQKEIKMKGRYELIKKIMKYYVYYLILHILNFRFYKFFKLIKFKIKYFLRIFKVFVK